MDAFLNRNFKVRGDISCLYQPGTVPSTLNVANIEVQLWHKSPMQVALLGKGITNSEGEFTVEFEIDSPVPYIVDGKISDVFLEAFYNGEKLVLSEPPPLLLGLVAYWKLDETTGTTAEDSAGFDHTGTLGGADIPTWGTGKINNGLVTHGGLDGTGYSYMWVPASEDFDFGTGDFTIAFWVKSNNTSGYYELFDTGYPVAESILFQFIPTSSVNLVIGGSTVISTSYAITSDTWYHVVIRRIGTDIDILINGSVIATTVFTDGISCPTANFCIGSYHTGTETLDGTLDEFGIWKGHGLTDESVAALYNSGAGLQYPFS